MSDNTSKHFNLPWHQYDDYWISVFALGGSFSPAATQLLGGCGLQPVAGNAMAIQTARDWKSTWDELHGCLKNAGVLGEIEVLLTPGDAPSFSNVALERKTPEAMCVLSENLWLGAALLEGRIMCYLQPIMSAQEKIFGYESFARVKMSDGSVIAGEQIVAAARALNIEYMIDRHLQVQALKTFIDSDFDGFLFINFFPGFIHRPAIYLEGLHSTAKSYGIIAKHLVLEFTQAGAVQDMKHLKDICDYGRSCGYSLALDDIETLECAHKLVPVVRPDFLKIDMRLVHRADEAKSRETIRQMVELVHGMGGIVVAEGVETEQMQSQLRALGVDLFQGYYFSPPLPVEAVLKKKSVN